MADIISKIMHYYLSKKTPIKTYSELIDSRTNTNLESAEYLNNLSGYRRGRRMGYYNEEFRKKFFGKQQKQDPLLQLYGNIPQLLADILPTDKIISDLNEVKIFLNHVSNMSYSFTIGIENFDGKSITFTNNTQKNHIEILKDNRQTKEKTIENINYSVDMAEIVEQYFSLT